MGLLTSMCMPPWMGLGPAQTDQANLEFTCVWVLKSVKFFFLKKEKVDEINPLHHKTLIFRGPLILLFIRKTLENDSTKN